MVNLVLLRMYTAVICLPVILAFPGRTIFTSSILIFTVGSSTVMFLLFTLFMFGNVYYVTSWIENNCNIFCLLLLENSVNSIQRERADLHAAIQGEGPPDASKIHD